MMEPEHIPQLQLLIEPAGKKPAGPNFELGQRLFEQAYEDAVQQRYPKAAQAFLEAADKLRASLSDPYAESFEAGRGAAYHNAWECYLAAGQRAQGRAALEARIKSDPSQAQSIQALLKAE